VSLQQLLDLAPYAQSLLSLVSHQDPIPYSILERLLVGVVHKIYRFRAPVTSIMIAAKEAKQNPSATEKYSFNTEQ
jgi:hypothetical protein